MKWQIARTPHSRLKFSLLITALIAVAAPTLHSQAAATGAATLSEGRSFDAVTIKQSGSASRGRSWRVTFNTYSAKNTPLARVILQAYLDGSPSTDRLKGAPGWVMNDYYDITAKVDDRTADGWKGLNQDRQMAMAAPLLRQMLADRCKLVAHTETTEISGYALVVGKHGIKMRLVPTDEPAPKNVDKITGGALLLYTPPRPDGKRSLIFVHTTMASLTASFGYSIVDKTGLQDEYDFELPKIDTGPVDDSAPPPAPDVAHQFDWGAVGLEMKPIKIQVPSLVIDHIERPSAN